MKTRKTSGRAIFAGIVMASCASLNGCSLTPTHESVSSYAVYDMKDSQKRTPDEIADLYIDTLKTIMNDVSVTRNLPPVPLPDEPGRFKLVNPLGDSGFGALAAASGASLNIPQCNGAYVVVASDNTGMSRWGENTRFYNCLWQYKDGWHLDWYISFDKRSGGVSADGMAAALVQSVTGDSRKNMKSYRDNIINKLNSKGLVTKLVESYPAG